MKTAKSHSIQLPAAEAAAISRALLAYADAAYPPGGSECSQASNQTLRVTAANIAQAHVTPVELRKRQLPTIKAAIRWYFSADNPGMPSNSPDPETLVALISPPKTR